MAQARGNLTSILRRVGGHSMLTLLVGNLILGVLWHRGKQ